MIAAIVQYRVSLIIGLIVLIAISIELYVLLRHYCRMHQHVYLLLRLIVGFLALSIVLPYKFITFCYAVFTRCFRPSNSDSIANPKQIRSMERPRPTMGLWPTLLLIVQIVSHLAHMHLCDTLPIQADAALLSLQRRIRNLFFVPDQH